MGATSTIIAFLVFGIFVFFGILVSGLFSGNRKVVLQNSMGIDEAEEILMDELDSVLVQKEKEKMSWFDKKTLELQQSHTGITLTTYLTIMFAVGLVLFLFAYMIFKEIPYAILAACLGYLAPGVVVKAKISKNIAIFNANLVKALRRMGSNMRAGGTLKQAIMDVGKSQSMPAAIRMEFINVLSDMEYGASPEQAFYSLYERVGSDDVRTLALTVEIQRRTGGNMSEAFDNLARIINRRELEEADIKATLSATKSSGMIISIIPFVLTALLNFISPNYFNEFYEWQGGFGKIIAFICYIIIGFGVYIMNKMTDIKC